MGTVQPQAGFTLDMLREQARLMGLSAIGMSKFVMEMWNTHQERENRLEIARVQSTAVKGSQTQPTEPGPEGPDVKIKMPNLIAFDEQVYYMDAYIDRFERRATEGKWSRSTWAQALASLLKGRAISIYQGLGTPMCNDYDALKRALMKGYGISADGMMRAFRQIRVRQGETYRAMLQRLQSSLKRYLELNNAVVLEDNTLFELMTREQFLEAVEPALRAKLKENEIVSNEAMAECADRWAEAHRPRQGGSSENRRHDQASGSGARPKESKSRVSHKPHKVSGPRCFTCGQPGRKAAQCKKSKRAEKGGTHAQIAGLGAHEGGDPLEHTLETARGLVNGKWTKVFRDRGATTHMVRESLVEPGNETGRTIHVRYPDGNHKDLIEVSLIVDTPYVKGKIRAVKCKDAVYGLLLGNAPGVSNSKSRSCGSDSQKTGPTPVGGDVTRQSAGSQAMAASPAKEQRQQAQGKRGKSAPFRQQKTGSSSKGPARSAPAGGQVNVATTQPKEQRRQGKGSKKSSKRNREGTGLVPHPVHTAFIAGVSVISDDSEVGQPRLYNRKQKETYKDVKISDRLTSEQSTQARQLTKEFSGVLSDVTKVADVEGYRVPLMERQAVRTKPYPVPHHLVPQVRAELKEMEREDVIEKSTSPYSSPMVIVKKPEGGVRICLDFRKLNSVIEFDAEPMFNQDEIFARLAPSNYFSKLDLTKGFWQIPLHQDSKRCTAFMTSEGLYQFTVLPFGLVNAPAVFNRTMRKVLGGIEGVEIFVDDVLIHSSTWEEHLQLPRQVFSRLQGVGMVAKPTKCEVGCAEVKYLGHVIGGGCSKPLPDKIQKIQDAVPPTTKTQVRSFLGLVGYYRKFIPDFASVAYPLTELTKKAAPTKVNWTGEEGASFACLKKKMVEQPILRLPDEDKEYILRTDASNTGVGAVLLQEHDGLVWPVAYYSRKLNDVERRYSTVERELLAAVVGIKKFYQYVYGRRFTFQVDHQPLSHLGTLKNANPRIMQWALFLQQFKFRVEYMKGADNVGADWLSRSHTPEEQVSDPVLSEVSGLHLTDEERDASSRSEESEDSASPGSPSQGVASVSGMTQTEAGAAELEVQPSFEASSRLEPGPGAEHSSPKSGNTTQDESEESPQVSQGDDA
ncbi:uncharacterized protein [Procambarus clarkii]|uniref:uncharacterized protein n=1 Tax=Procambarus clarkii TaxID=6728 RepID=UPI003742D13C